jgi:competence protein ComEC
VARRANGTGMRTAPLLPVALGLIAGILLDHRFGAAPLWYFGAFLVLSAVLASRLIRTSFGLPVVFLLAASLGGMLHVRAARIVPPDSIERHTSPERRLARIRGVVASEPRLRDAPEHIFRHPGFGSERTVFLLDAEVIEGTDEDVPVTGRIRVTLHEAVLDLRENERVEVLGWLRRLRPTRNPGAFDWAAFYRRQGVVATLSCDHRESLRRLDVLAPRPEVRAVRWLRTTVRGLLTADLATGADEEATLLDAMVLGHRSRLDRRLNEIFVKAGVVHFLAVSGTHVVVVTSFVWLLGRVLGRSRRQCAWMMILAVCTYALIAEPRPPILRATVITLLLCASLLLGRPRSHLNWISAAAVALLVIDPTGLFDVGFQLSFSAVLGVAYLTPAILQAIHGWGGAVRRMLAGQPSIGADGLEADPAIRASMAFPRRLARLAYACFIGFPAVSAGAWLASMPIVAVHFGRVHPWSCLNSVLVFPLVYAVMILGLVRVLLGGLVPALSPLLGTVLVWADQGLIRLVEQLAVLPGASLRVVSPPWWLVATYYVCAVLFARAFRSVSPYASASVRSVGRGDAHREHVRSLRAAWVVATIVLLFCAAGWRLSRRPSARLTLTVLAVGDGLATVIELPKGQTLLYDVGTMGSYDVGRHAVVPFLWHRGVARLDQVLLSHPNLDHFSGLPAVLDAFEVGRILVNDHFRRRSVPGTTGGRLLELLADREQVVSVLDPSEPRWTWGGVTFDRLWPPNSPGDAAGEGPGPMTTNDTSTVLRISYAGRSILLTGDIEAYAQQRLLAQGNLQANVLMLPHHGSVAPTLPAFVSAVDPEIFIRSSGERMTETFTGLQVIVGGTPLYNTADDGAVQVVIDGSGVHVSSMNPRG